MFLQFVIGTLTFDRFFYWLGFTSVFAGGLAVSAVVFLKAGDRLIMPFLLTVLAGVWVGFLVNIFDYGLIRQVLVQSRNGLAQSYNFDRILGFFGNPNMAAFAVVATLTGLLTSRQFMRASLLVHAAVLSASVAGVIMTGSRTSTVLVICLLAWYFVKMLRQSGSGRVAVARAVVAPLFLAAIAYGALSGTALLLGSDSSAYTTAAQRLETLPSIITPAHSSQDPSVAQRVQVLPYYVRLVKERPLAGWGPDYATTKVDDGTLTNVSQNSWLEWAVAYGTLYPALVAVALLTMLRRAGRLRSSEPQEWARVVLVTVIFVMASFSLTDLLFLRAFVVVVGMALGLLIRASHRQDSGSGAVNSGRGLSSGEA
jgi:hypothetical protein